jgi:uncharacterized protein (UPF0332 family)
MSLLKRGMHDDLQRLARLHPTLVNRTELDLVIDQVVDDRLRFARSFLEFAATVAAAPVLSEIHARNAVSRTYYAAHHAGRALILFTTRDDPFGHIETAIAIEVAVRKLPRLATRIGPDAKSRVLGWQRLRSRADYSIYGVEDAGETEIDFPQEAPRMLTECEAFVSSIETYILSERTRP